MTYPPEINTHSTKLKGSWTPEPWMFYPNGTTGADQTPMFSIGFGIAGQLGEVVGEPNATRIVACVNGCAGLNPAAYRACLETLKAMLPDYEALAYEPDNATPQVRKDLVADAKEALAQAEKKG